MPLGISRIDVNWLMKEIEQRHNRRGVGNQVECVITLGVGDGRVGILKNKELNDIQVSIPCSPLYRGSDKVSALCVNISTLF